jgi:hypothetical protein
MRSSVADARDARALFSPARLANDPRVRARARRLGLDVRELVVEVRSVSLHTDSKEPDSHTLHLRIAVRDRASSRVYEIETTALVTGNLKKSS